VKPILKWAGGKRYLIPYILDLFPPNYQNLTYHEPFFGSGALFFEVKPTSGSINDLNPDLIRFYKSVRDNPEDLMSTAMKYKYQKEVFYKLRKRFNYADLTDLERAALLLYFNKTAFNGLYRVNSKGKFNVPYGTYKNPTIVPRNRILAASKILKKVGIFNKDFTYILDYAKEGDLCYFDPPYHPVSDTANFTSYSENGFNMSEQKRLRDICLDLDAKGVYWVLSNSFVPQIRKLYENQKNIEVKTVQSPRRISSKSSTRGLINEFLATNIKRIREHTLSSDERV